MSKKRFMLMKSTYLTLKALMLFIIVLSTIAYFTPLNALQKVYKFEQHHFFLFCFLSSAFFLFFLKLYISLTEEEGLLNKKITNLKRTIIKKEFSNQPGGVRNDWKLTDASQISKEEIAALKFDHAGLSFRPDELIEIENNLKKAMLLGNAYKQKVKLFFKDIVGLRYVETTVWFVGDKHVTLKKGVVIPKNQIFKVLI